MSLDLAKLQNVKPTSKGWQAACPACRKEGRDFRDSNHLSILKTGEYSCCVYPGDKVHNTIIHSLAGVNSDGSTEIAPEVSRQIELPKTWSVDVLDKLVKDHSYWNRRGISDETLAPFRGGVAVDGQMKGRYVFPIFDELNEDKLVGFSGRRVDGLPDIKWKHIGSKSLFVFGDVDEIESSHRVILVESIGDLLSLREHGIKDVLCLFGITLSQVLLAKLIALNPSSIIISTNRDVKHTVGQDAAEKIKRTLSKFFDESAIQIVFPVERDGSKDWGDSRPEDIKAAFAEKP